MAFSYFIWCTNIETKLSEHFKVPHSIYVYVKQLECQIYKLKKQNINGDKMEITHDEFIEKYADVRMTFSSYYKYEFTYIGQTDDGVKVSVTYGGDANQIYRFSLDAGHNFLLGETAMTFKRGVSERIDTKEELFDFYDF